MPGPNSKKIILAGCISVGKTSIVQKFVYDKFSEKYKSNIGVRIEKKALRIQSKELNFIIWDLAGESTQNNCPQSYFLGANGIIYVVDIIKTDSFQNLRSEINFLKKKLPKVPILLIANKADLLEEDEKRRIVSDIPIEPDFVTSAKTGLAVNDVFEEMGSLMINGQNVSK